jgi:hypothetical protein
LVQLTASIPTREGLEFLLDALHAALTQRDLFEEVVETVP